MSWNSPRCRQTTPRWAARRSRFRLTSKAPILQPAFQPAIGREQSARSLIQGVVRKISREPGHVFPLRARAGGVLERRGQTEAAVDMTSLAGFYPAGVICEIVNDDGTMARVPDLIRFCKKHKLVMITVSELARYRMDLDDGRSEEAFEGFIPVCPRFSAQGARRFEPGDLIASPTSPASKPTAVAA